MLTLSRTKCLDRDGPPSLAVAGRIALACAVAVLFASCKDEARTMLEPGAPPAPSPTPRPIRAAEPKMAVHVPPRAGEFAPGIAYTNYRFAEIPWSIQVVRVDRSHRDLELHSAVAQGVI